MKKTELTVRVRTQAVYFILKPAGFLLLPFAQEILLLCSSVRHDIVDHLGAKGDACGNQCALVSAELIRSGCNVCGDVVGYRLLQCLTILQNKEESRSKCSFIVLPQLFQGGPLSLCKIELLPEPGVVMSPMMVFMPAR